ncbi:MAG: LytTR family DNA-binding domain-containing protein [Marinoscillum sp.]
MIDFGVGGLIIYSGVGFIYYKQSVASGDRCEKIKVNHLNRTVILSTKNIQYIKTERPYIRLVTADTSYLHTGSLNGFLSKNPAGEFCQIHKSTVINSAFLKSYTSRKNGDYDVEMQNGDVVRASRNFNSHFRSFSRSQVSS